MPHLTRCGSRSPAERKARDARPRQLRASEGSRLGGDRHGHRLRPRRSALGSVARSVVLLHLLLLPRPGSSPPARRLVRSPASASPSRPSSSSRPAHGAPCSSSSCEVPGPRNSGVSLAAAKLLGNGVAGVQACLLEAPWYTHAAVWLHSSWFLCKQRGPTRLVDS
uniref:Uncharacterized protein n=1 Tax=Triticum urartu TaxID=4572 RepID=A0A8R7UH03_TRIUA